MQTQVCWTPNPVFFPLPLEEELGGAPSAHTSHPLPLHITLWDSWSGWDLGQPSRPPFSHRPFPLP